MLIDSNEAADNNGEFHHFMDHNGLYDLHCRRYGWEYEPVTYNHSTKKITTYLEQLEWLSHYNPVKLSHLVITFPQTTVAFLSTWAFFCCLVTKIQTLLPQLLDHLPATFHFMSKSTKIFCINIWKPTKFSLVLPSYTIIWQLLNSS